MGVRTVMKTAFGTDERVRQETPPERAAASIDRLTALLSDPDHAVPAATVDEAIRQIVGAPDA